MINFVSYMDISLQVYMSVFIQAEWPIRPAANTAAFPMCEVTLGVFSTPLQSYRGTLRIKCLAKDCN